MIKPEHQTEYQFEARNAEALYASGQISFEEYNARAKQIIDKYSK